MSARETAVLSGRLFFRICGGIVFFENLCYTLSKERRVAMNVCILMGSPRKEGNTAALLQPFCEELKAHGAETEVHWLYDLDLRPCLACRSCQKDHSVFGCAQKDDGIMKIAVVRQLDHTSMDEIQNAITAQLDKIAAEKKLTMPEALKVGACAAAASLSEVSASDGVKTAAEVLKLAELYG